MGGSTGRSRLSSLGIVVASPSRLTRKASGPRVDLHGGRNEE
jgi:hypothetical protein